MITREEYVKNPNYCLCCGKVILIKKGSTVKKTRIKKYCSNSCSAKSKNRKSIVPNKTKGELFSYHKNWQSARSVIRKWAEKTYLQHYPEKECFVCGYNKHVEICHKKPVSEFPDTVLIKEINDINNLVGLCPTHHWEFDEGLLIL